MSTVEIRTKAVKELLNTIESVDENQLQEFMDAILKAKKIYVSGAGRSLLMLRCLAMRLMHLGLESYVVGDTITPAFEAEDLLICASGSGETSGLINVAKKAKAIGGKLAAITIKKESTLGQLADVLVEISGYTDKIAYENMKKPVLAGATLFEQSVLIIADVIVLPLAEKVYIPTNKAFSRHANLE